MSRHDPLWNSKLKAYFPSWNKGFSEHAKFRILYYPPLPCQKTKQKNFVFSEKDQGMVLFCQWKNSLKVDNSWIIQEYTLYNWKKNFEVYFHPFFLRKERNLSC